MSYGLRSFAGAVSCFSGRLLVPDLEQDGCVRFCINHQKNKKIIHLGVIF